MDTKFYCSLIERASLNTCARTTNILAPGHLLKSTRKAVLVTKQIPRNLNKPNPKLRKAPVCSVLNHFLI
jgi:hypothetical protein